MSKALLRALNIPLEMIKQDAGRDDQLELVGMPGHLDPGSSTHLCSLVSVARIRNSVFAPNTQGFYVSEPRRDYSKFLRSTK
jgi:hypothetical protein